MENIKEGTLIRATHRPIDLIPAFVNELIRRKKSPWKVLEASNEQWPEEQVRLCAAMEFVEPDFDVASGEHKGVRADIDHDWWDTDIDNGSGWSNHQENSHTIGELIDLLNEDLPEGMYFGTHEGDGSDFGYWMSQEDQES